MRDRPSIVRCGQALLAVVLLSGLNSASAQTTSASPTPSTTQMREAADALLRANAGSDVAARAQKFLELTNVRPWRYMADDGQWMTYRAAYEAESVRGGVSCLTFNSRRYVPLKLLDAQATADLAEITALRTALADDFRKWQAAETARVAAAEEARKQAEAVRRTELADSARRQVRMLVDTDVEVVEAAGRQVLSLAQGEVLELVGESATDYIVKAGGRLVQIDRRRAEEIAATLVMRPTMPEASAVPAGPPAPKLDCRIGSYLFPDGRSALQIEAVAVGGLGSRYGLQAGDVVVRVNDMAVGTLDDYRVASIRAGCALKLLVFMPAVQKERVISIPAPGSTVPLGVAGRIDYLGEFRIDDVDEGSIADLIGLRRDDKLLRVNDVAIGSADDLKQIEATSGGEFRVRALVQGEPKTLLYP